MPASKKVGYALIVAGAALLASLGSHLVAHWLSLKTRAAEPFVIGSASAHREAFLAGSSVADYGVDWERVAEIKGLKIRVWGIAAGSPVEHEQFQTQVPDASTTFIAVSAVDLDEALISDFRAAIVPIGRAFRSLVESGATFKYAHEVLSQYPVTWLRTLYPTLGRSRGIMGATRLKLKAMLKPNAPVGSDEGGPSIKFDKKGSDDSYRSQRMSSWSDSEVQKKIVAMRVTFKGPSSFNGLKHLAFARMLHLAVEKGPAVVLVMPSSPAYKKAFLPDDVARQFEKSLNDLKSLAPEALWLRMDQVPVLSSADYFCDLSHLNEDGKKIVTAALEKAFDRSVAASK